MDIVALPFQGRLGLGEQSRNRYSEMCQSLQQGSRTVVFDLREVPDITSEGLGFLVECLTTVQRVGGELRLAALSRQVERTLEITRLDRVFPVFASVEAALAAQAATARPA